MNECRASQSHRHVGVLPAAVEALVLEPHVVSEVGASVVSGDATQQARASMRSLSVLLDSGLL